MMRHRKPWRLFLTILKEAFPFILISFVILTTLVFVQQVGKYSNIILSFQASIQTTGRFLVSLIPGIAIITLPVSLLLGTVIACSRLSSDSELIAAQSLGVSKLSLALPFIFYGLLGFLLTTFLSAEVAPRALKELKSLRTKILLQEATTQIRPHTFITTFPDFLLHVQDVDPKTGEWLGVFILQQDQARGVSRLLTSERGQLRITSAPKIAIEAQLYKGISLENRVAAPSQNTSASAIAPAQGATTASVSTPISQATSDFEKLSIKLSEKDVTDDDSDVSYSLTEMTLGEVGWAARTAKNEKDRLRARVEWHKRFAFPCACLTLTCVTFIVAVRGKRFSTRPRTVVAILFVAMAFYLVLVSGQNMANSGALPVWLGVWLSNILLGAYIIKSFVTNRQLIHLSPPQWLSKISDSDTFLSIFKTFKHHRATAGEREANTRSSVPFRFSLINLINYLIVSEIIKYYLLALGALVMTSVIFTLFDLIPAMSKSGTSLGYAASYLGYLAPQLAYFVSPFAMLVAILTGCSVLARTNQLTALASAGQGQTRLITAIMIAAVSLSLGLWFVSDYFLPRTNREQDVRYHKIKNKQLEQTTIAFGKKWVYGKNNTIYSYQRIDGDNSLFNASIYTLAPTRGVLEKVTNFGQAAQLSASSWRAADGWTDLIKPNLAIERLPLKDDYSVIQINDGASLFKRTVNESSKMSSGDLYSYIRQLKEIGIATTELRIDYVKRIAFPFSCLTLALLAAPFATGKRARRTSALLSVAIGVGISLVFWLLMTVFEAAGKQSSLPISLSVWGPQILFLTLGIYLNFRQRQH